MSYQCRSFGTCLIFKKRGFSVGVYANTIVSYVEHKTRGTLVLAYIIQKLFIVKTTIFEYDLKLNVIFWKR